MPVCTLLYGNLGLDSAPKARFCAVPPQKFDSLRSLRMTYSSGHSSRGSPHPSRSATPVSLRLGLARALTTVQVVIHSPRAASLPAGVTKSKMRLRLILDKESRK